jgi:hypothetical protein
VVSLLFEDLIEHTYALLNKPLLMLNHFQESLPSFLALFYQLLYPVFFWLDRRHKLVYGILKGLDVLWSHICNFLHGIFDVVNKVMAFEASRILNLLKL